LLDNKKDQEEKGAIAPTLKYRQHCNEQDEQRAMTRIVTFQQRLKQKNHRNSKKYSNITIEHPKIDYIANKYSHKIIDK
jgi:hypothetical protein